MIINKLDLLAKGWKTSEIEQASRILEKAEGDKHGKMRLVDRMLLILLIALMIINGLVCSLVLVPFIYTMQTNMILLLVTALGLIFSALFTLIIYDTEKIHHKHETSLFLTFIINGVVDFYLILEFTARFGITTKLPLEHNAYIVASTYLVAFIIPHLVYQLRKKSEI